MATIEYTGHHGTSGLQSHSIGDEYPIVIYGVGTADGPTKWAIMDGSTGFHGVFRYDTYKQAQEVARTVLKNLYGARP